MAKRGRPASRKQPAKAPFKKAAARMASVPSELDQLLTALEELSVVALRKVIECATALLEQKTEGERKSFIEEVTARAMGLGMSLTDLLGKAVPESMRPVSMGGKKAKAGGKGAGLTVKYRGPNEGDTWTGRGRPPRWLVALEATGKKRIDYAV